MREREREGKIVQGRNVSVMQSREIAFSKHTRADLVPFDLLLWSGTFMIVRIRKRGIFYCFVPEDFFASISAISVGVLYIYDLGKSELLVITKLYKNTGCKQLRKIRLFSLHTLTLNV